MPSEKEYITRYEALQLDHDIMRAQLKAAEDKLANIGQYIDAYQVASIRVPSYWLKKIKQALTNK